MGWRSGAMVEPAIGATTEEGANGVNGIGVG